MEPVEDRFTKVAEFTLRLAYCLAAIGEKRRRLCGKDALFGQESFHPLIRFRFQPMDECEHLTATFSSRPPTHLRGKKGGLRSWWARAPAIDADRAQWISLRQTKFIESRLA
jgi:hypothetical protein